MEDIEDAVVVNAPVERVWEAIRVPGEHAAWHPFVTTIEGDHALGATRTCQVTVGGKQRVTEERCSAYDEGRAIAWTVDRDETGFSRMVADWRTGFSLEQQGPRTTRVAAQSVFTPRRLSARLMLPVIRRKFHQTQRAILDELKRHAEAGG